MVFKNLLKICVTSFLKIDYLKHIIHIFEIRIQSEKMIADTRLVADTVDCFTKILCRIGSIRFVTQEVSGAISVRSASDGNARIILASMLGLALIVLVAVHSVAGIHFF